MIHYHSCPSCYEKPSCEMDCSIEPDLEDDGRQFGSHSICDECKHKKHSPLRPMMKGYDRARSQILGKAKWSYWYSDSTHHYFLPENGGSAIDIDIVDGDFDLDFDKYNGIK